MYKVGHQRQLMCESKRAANGGQLILSMGTNINKNVR